MHRRCAKLCARAFSVMKMQGEKIRIKFQEGEFVTYNCESPERTAEVGRDELLGYYRQMVTIRRMEMAADALYKSKMIRGFCHLATGQVAVR